MKSFLLFKMDTYSVQFSSYGHYSKKSMHDIVSKNLTINDPICQFIEGIQTVSRHKTKM